MSKIAKGVGKVFKKVWKVAKVVLPIALAAAAVVFTAGAALGPALGITMPTFGGAVASVVGGLSLSPVLAGALTGAVTSAGFGAAAGLVTGGVKGAQKGALFGAATGGVLGAVSPGMFGIGAKGTLIGGTNRFANFAAEKAAGGMLPNVSSQISQLPNVTPMTGEQVLGGANPLDKWGGMSQLPSAGPLSPAQMAEISPNPLGDIPMPGGSSVPGVPGMGGGSGAADIVPKPGVPGVPQAGAAAPPPGVTQAVDPVTGLTAPQQQVMSGGGMVPGGSGGSSGGVGSLLNSPYGLVGAGQIVTGLFSRSASSESQKAEEERAKRNFEGVYTGGTNPIGAGAVYPGAYMPNRPARRFYFDKEKNEVVEVKGR